MKNRTIAAWSAVGFLAIGLLLLRRDSGPHPVGAPTGVLLSFDGITNVPVKGDYAIFSVTNGGSRRTAFSPIGLEYLNSKAWVTNSLLNRNRDDWLYWYNDLAGNVLLGNWYDFGGDLKPGASATFAAPFPITNAPWRLHFLCKEQSAGIQGFVDRTGDVVQHTTSVMTNGAARNQVTFSGRYYYLMSPDISN
jgi:hypothetical protein